VEGEAVFARLASFEDIGPGDADRALRWMRERAVPAARELEGFRAATAMIDREHGTMVVITFFERREHLDAAVPSFEETAASMPEDLSRPISESLRAVEVFEVALRDSSRSQGYLGGVGTGPRL
jgi:hypothetical protein